MRTTIIGINWQVSLRNGRLHRINAFSQNLTSSQEFHLLTDDKTGVRSFALSLAESTQNGMTSFKRLPQRPPVSFPGSSRYLEKLLPRGIERTLGTKRRQRATLSVTNAVQCSVFHVFTLLNFISPYKNSMN